ncbi:MAG: putative lipid II flippase FtsW [Desulfovibrionaceae bacterium]|nr:putative lipid II flippase FtsW [Desulfovibrionaceae bacterium]
MSVPDVQAQGHGQGAKHTPSVAATKEEKIKYGPYDWWLFTIMTTILAIGLVMVLSSSSIIADSTFHDKYYFFKRQLFYTVIGGISLWIAALIPLKFLYRLHYWALLLTLLLLLLTLTPLAPTINGARRWITLGFASIQPMEFVKIAIVLYLAYFMSTKHATMGTFWRGVFPPCLVTGVYCAILLTQPDFGSAIVLAGILFFMCIAGGVRIIYILWSIVLGVASIALLSFSAPYRMERLKAFMDPFQDPSGAGYQLIQSFYALASGGFFGVGVGASQQKMFYLPEAHNDFIMSVLGEEMGLAGLSLIMFLFLCLFWRCYRIIIHQTEMRAKLTAFGLTAIIAIGALINLAVVLGMMPPKGVAMPLLSYGGSNLIATMLCIGLILNFSRQTGSCAKSS